MVVIDFAVFGGKTVATFDTMRANYTLSVHGITNINGDGVLLPNNGPTLSAGSKSFAKYVPNIAFSTLTELTDLTPLCLYSKYNVEFDLVSEKVHLIENSTSLTNTAVNQVRILMKERKNIHLLYSDCNFHFSMKSMS